MTAAPWNIIIEQDSAFLYPMVYKDSAGAPFNLTSYTASMMIRSHIASVDPLVTLTTGNGGITLGTTGGEITLSLSKNQTGALEAGSGVYDLYLKPSGQDQFRLLSGHVEISASVTR